MCLTYGCYYCCSLLFCHLIVFCLPAESVRPSARVGSLAADVLLLPLVLASVLGSSLTMAVTCVSRHSLHHSSKQQWMTLTYLLDDRHNKLKWNSREHKIQLFLHDFYFTSIYFRDDQSHLVLLWESTQALDIMRLENFTL